MHRLANNRTKGMHHERQLDPDGRADGALHYCKRLRPLACHTTLERAGAPGYRLAEVARPAQFDDLKVVLAISGGGTRAAARRSYLAQVTFDWLKDPAERLYFKQVKASLTLPKDQVDRLREVAGRLLREAPAFRALLSDLQR